MLEQTTALLATLKANAFKLISVSLLYLAPIQMMIIGVMLAILFDTCMGRWAAKQIAIREGKEPRLEVTSRKTRIGFLSKAFAYIGSLIFVFIIDKSLFNDLLLYFLPNFPIKFFISKGFGVILILLELDSADEKIFRVKGIRLKDHITNKIKGVKGFVTSIISFKKEIDDIKKD